jgi:hypothetical protein
MVVPRTVVGWHRLGFRLFWRVKAHLLEIEAVLSDVIAEFSIREKANIEVATNMLLKLADIESKCGLVTRILRQNASWL